MGGAVTEPAPMDAPVSAGPQDVVGARRRFRTEQAEPTIREVGRRRFWRESLLRRMLGGADVAAAGLVTLVAATSTPELVWSLAILPVWVVLAKLFGLYDRDQMSIRHLTVDELPQIAAWAAAGTATLGALLYIVPIPTFTVAHAVLIWFCITTLGAFLRGGTRWLWRRITPPELTCVLGRGDLARAARRKIELFEDMHLKLVDVDDRLPHGGVNGDAKELVRMVDRIIVATEQMDVPGSASLRSPAGPRRQAQRRLAAARSCGPVAQALRGRGPSGARVRHPRRAAVDDPDQARLRRRRLVLRADHLRAAAPDHRDRDQARQPRAAVVRPDTRRSPRSPFRVYKFRTMRDGADQMLEELVRIDDLPEPVFKFRRDPRVTSVGSGAAASQPRRAAAARERAAGAR